LLRATGRPLAEIAAECGFASQSHLTTQFKLATGSTPKQFRDST
jgi:AraC family transcriptional regulator